MTGDISPIKDRKILAEFAEEFDYCWACGHANTWSNGYPRWLTIHHIIKFGRSDERCNLCRLCRLCHDSLEHSRIRVDGVVVPKLTLGMVLFLKGWNDAEHFDAERLRVLYQKNLPEPIYPPAWYLREFARNRPTELLWYSD